LIVSVGATEAIVGIVEASFGAVITTTGTTGAALEVGTTMTSLMTTG